MEKKVKYFLFEDKFNQTLEKGFFSTITFDIAKSSLLTPERLKGKVKKIFSESYIENNTEYYKEIIYQHPSGFYIYFSKLDIMEANFKVKIFFLPDNRPDIEMFINFIK